MFSFLRLRCKDTAVFLGEQAIYMRGEMAYMSAEDSKQNLYVVRRFVKSA